MVRGPGMLLGGAEAGLQTIALPGGSLLGSQQPGRGCRPPNLPWSCPGKMGHSALLSADQRTGRGSCHHPAGCTDSGGGVGLGADNHLTSGNLPSIHPRGSVPSTHVPSTRLLPAGRRCPTRAWLKPRPAARTLCDVGPGPPSLGLCSVSSLKRGGGRQGSGGRGACG